MTIESTNTMATITKTGTTTTKSPPSTTTTATTTTRQPIHNKRKGNFDDDPKNHVVLINVEPRNPSTVSSSSSSSGNDAIHTLKVKLQQRRNTYMETSMMIGGGGGSGDPLLSLLQSVGQDDPELFNKLKTTSKTIQTDLRRQINIAQEACTLESNVLVELSSQLRTLEESRDQLLQDIDEIDQRQIDLQHQIALHQQETTEEMEVIDQVEDERKREVPRLKHTLSLYASTTGIKWDFLQPDMLSGSVVSSLPCRKSMIDVLFVLVCLTDIFD